LTFLFRPAGDFIQRTDRLLVIVRTIDLGR
jgi:hypothetical protein